MGIANYVRNGRRFGDRKCSLGAKIPKMSLQAYDSSQQQQQGAAGSARAASRTLATTVMEI